MARVRELMYWNLDNTARSEWANLVKAVVNLNRRSWRAMRLTSTGGI
ncbi:lytic murein transglycosylase [Salmonella enterica subsp. enterica serovar Choleraesuis str. 0006]|nr:lytic murein transglycosylase [Salmonella enterica subsp. enterica serovar Choleraesuis str. 0006]